jgi:nitrite reductase (NO-forming)
MSTSVRTVRVTALGVLALALVACGGAASAPATATPPAPLTVTITMKEFAFEPAQISARVGQPVKLTFVNQGTLLHDFTSLDAMVEAMNADQGAEHSMDDMMDDAALHMAVDVGHSESLEFMPTQAGTYTFFCTVEGHQAAGMTGTLVVTP